VNDSHDKQPLREDAKFLPSGFHSFFPVDNAELSRTREILATTPVVQISVLYFAAVKERTRLSEERFELPPGAVVADAVAAVSAAHPNIEPLCKRLKVAVNQQVEALHHPLTDGDELALLPPVAGGHDSPAVAVRSTCLSLDAVVNAVKGPDKGGLVTFSGAVRSYGNNAQGSAGPKVTWLEYEAYVPMAEKVLRAIATEIETQWPESRVAIHHRIGRLSVGELAVVIAVSAPHRAEAFEGCRAAIEQLKVRAPIWKKERDESGDLWVGLGP